MIRYFLQCWRWWFGGGRKIAKCDGCQKPGWYYCCDDCGAPLCYGCAQYLYDESWLCEQCDNDRKEQEQQQHLEQLQAADPENWWRR